MRSNREICRTCVHAEWLGALSERGDLYCCDALVRPLREYAASDAALAVLVAGCRTGCADHYEKNGPEFEAVWRLAQDGEEKREGMRLYGAASSLPFGMRGEALMTGI